MVALLSYIVFDPIRSFFIRNKVTHRFSLDTITSTTSMTYQFFEKWFKKDSWNVFEKSRHSQDRPNPNELSREDKPLVNLSGVPTPSKSIKGGADWGGEIVEREKDVIKLTHILDEAPENFILVLGPSGSGKSGLLRHILSSKPYKLVLDCEDLVGANSEAILLSR